MVSASISILTDKLAKEIANSAAEAIYHSVLLAMDIDTIEDYKRNPQKYLSGNDAKEYLSRLIAEKRHA